MKRSEGKGEGGTNPESAIGQLSQRSSHKRRAMMAFHRSTAGLFMCAGRDLTPSQVNKTLPKDIFFG